MKRSIVAVAVFALVLTPATIALGDPNLPNVRPHRHYVLTPNGDRVEVGPRLCDDLDDLSLQHAFNQFHNNVHHSTGVAPGDVLGPNPGAPGLRNETGAELIPARC